MLLLLASFNSLIRFKVNRVLGRILINIHYKTRWNIKGKLQHISRAFHLFRCHPLVYGVACNRRCKFAVRTVYVKIYKISLHNRTSIPPQHAKNHICVDFALILATELLWDLPVSWEGISFDSSQSTGCHQANLRLSLRFSPQTRNDAASVFPRVTDFACVGVVWVGSWFEIRKLKHISPEISLVSI